MKSSVGVNHSGIATVKRSSIFILFVFAAFPLSRYCLFSVQQNMSVSLFFIALGTNQHDALNISILFTPFFFE